MEVLQSRIALPVSVLVDAISMDNRTWLPLPAFYWLYNLLAFLLT